MENGQDKNEASSLIGVIKKYLKRRRATTGPEVEYFALQSKRCYKSWTVCF